MLPIFIVLALPLNPVPQKVEPALRVKVSEWMTLNEPEAVWKRIDRKEYSGAGTQLIPPENFLWFVRYDDYLEYWTPELGEKARLFETKLIGFFDLDRILRETWVRRRMHVEPPPNWIPYSNGKFDFSSFDW